MYQRYFHPSLLCLVLLPLNHLLCPQFPGRLARYILWLINITFHAISMSNFKTDLEHLPHRDVTLQSHRSTPLTTCALLTPCPRHLHLL
jgi:hypothetical protein